MVTEKSIIATTLRAVQDKLDGELENVFTYHAPTPDMLPKFEAVRNKAKELAYMIQLVVPDSKERVIAINMIESAVQWANAGIARRQVSVVAADDLPPDA